MVTSFKEFIEEHHDDIHALQVLYSVPYAERLTYRDVKDLAETLSRPPHNWTTDRLWAAYDQLDRDKVRGSGQRILTDLSLWCALPWSRMTSWYRSTISWRRASRGGWLCRSRQGRSSRTNSGSGWAG